MVNVVQTNTNNVLNVDGNGNITGTPGVIRPSLPDDFGITLNAIDANPVAGIVNAAAPAINPLDLFEIDLSLVDAANPGTFPFEGVDGVAYDDPHFVTTKNMADINYRDNKFYELLADMFFRLVASKGDWGKVTRDDGTSYVGTSNNDVSFFFDAPNGQEKQIAWDVETGTVTIAGQQLELGQQAEFDAVIDGQAGKATVALFRDPADNKIKAEIQFGDVGIQLIQEHLDNGLVFTNVQTDTDKVKHELSGIIGELNSAAVTIQNHKTDANNDGTSDEAEWIRDKYELNRIDEKKQTLVEDAAAKAQQVAQKTDDIQVNRWTSASIAQSNGTAANTTAKAATPAPKPAPAPVTVPAPMPKPANDKGTTALQANPAPIPTPTVAPKPQVAITPPPPVATPARPSTTPRPPLNNSTPRPTTAPTTVPATPPRPVVSQPAPVPTTPTTMPATPMPTPTPMPMPTATVPPAAPATAPVATAPAATGSVTSVRTSSVKEY